MSQYNKNPFEVGNNNDNANPFEIGRNKTKFERSQRVKKRKEDKINQSVNEASTRYNTNSVENKRKLKKVNTASINNTQKETNTQATQVKTYTSSTKSKNQKRKRKLKIYIIVTIALVGIPLAAEATSNWFNETEYKRVEAVDNYEYNFEDYKSEYKEDQNALFEQTPQGGEIIVFENDGSDSEPSETIKKELVVGEDLEPGVYTIQTGKNVRVHSDNYYSTLHKDNTYYNVPLVTGDTLSLITYDEDTNMEDMKVVFTPQSEYKMYEPGLSGLFIYGLSYDEVQITISEDNYDSIVYNFRNKSNYERSQYLSNTSDGDITISSGPGSYFVVETSSGW